MNTNALLSELRDVLHAPGHRSWRRLARLLGALPDDSGAQQLAMDYAREHLQRWPWRLRVALPGWLDEALATGRAPAPLRLAASLTLGEVHDPGLPRVLAQIDDLRGLDFVSVHIDLVLQVLRERPERWRLEHLGLGRVTTPPQEQRRWLERVCAVAPPVRSLHVWGAPRPRRTRRSPPRRLPRQVLRWGSLEPLGDSSLLEHLDALQVGFMSELSQVAAMPFKHLKRLALHGLTPESEKVSEAVARAPALADLEWLELTECHLLGQDVVALSRSPNLQRLKVLSLAGNPIGTRGVRELAQGPLAGLEALDLSGCELEGAGGVDALGDAPFIERLRVLAMRDNALSEKALERLGRDAAFQGLQGALLKDALAPAARPWRWPGDSPLRLEVLEVAAARGGSPEIVRSVAALSQTLRALDLSGHGIGEVGCMDLCRRAWPELRLLRLREAGITGSAASHFIDGLERFPRLEALILRDNRVSKGVAAHLAASAASRVSALDLDQNRLSSGLQRDIHARCGAPPEPALTIGRRGGVRRFNLLPDLDRDLRLVEEPGADALWGEQHPAPFRQAGFPTIERRR